MVPGTLPESPFRKFTYQYQAFAASAERYQAADGMGYDRENMRNAGHALGAKGHRVAFSAISAPSAISALTR